MTSVFVSASAAFRDAAAARTAATHPALTVTTREGSTVSLAHIARGWLAKLQLVASGAGITTLPASMAASVPQGVRVLKACAYWRCAVVRWNDGGSLRRG